MTMSFAACAQNKGDSNMQTENKPLVVYFSATGTTAKAARTIAEVSGGTLYEIVPQQAYTSDDLDWNDRQSRSSVEMNNPQARSALKDTKPDIAAYDVIFIGYPIWSANYQYIHREPRPERQDTRAVCHIRRKRDKQ